MSHAAISSPADAQLELERAVLFYRSRDHRSLYATCHPVSVANGRPALLAGAPLTLEKIAGIATLAAQRTAYSGFVHPRAIYIGPNVLAWWLPAGTRRVWFAHDGTLGKRSGDASHPPLLFIARPGAWYVFALRRDERPDPGAALYVAPYFNVWEDGKICTGNVDVPVQIGPQGIAGFEEAFFRSRFTHPNTPRLIRRHGGAVRLWQDLLDGAPFPLKCLIDAKKTLGEAISHCIATD